MVFLDNCCCCCSKKHSAVFCTVMMLLSLIHSTFGDITLKSLYATACDIDSNGYDYLLKYPKGINLCIGVCTEIASTVVLILLLYCILYNNNSSFKSQVKQYLPLLFYICYLLYIIYIIFSIYFTYKSLYSPENPEYKSLHEFIMDTMYLYLGINVIYYIITGNYIHSVEKEENEVEEIKSIENV